MAKVKIFAPNKKYSGKVGSVVFVDGVGVIDDETDQSELKYFKRNGQFGIGEEAQEQETEETAPESDDDAQEDEPESAEEVEIPGMPNSKAKRPEWAEFAESMGISTEGLSIAQMKEKVIAEYSAK